MVRVLLLLVLMKRLLGLLLQVMMMVVLLQARSGSPTLLRSVIHIHSRVQSHGVAGRVSVDILMGMRSFDVGRVVGRNGRYFACQCHWSRTGGASCTRYCVAVGRR